MELKDYQRETVEKVQQYLLSLSRFKDKKQKISVIDEEHAKSMDPSLYAWNEIMGEDKAYYSKKNGIGEFFPNFNLKVPTGGGKTLLATHTIDLINGNLRNKKTGFVLWIVPTNQIYRQTLSSLKDRNHPYRQVLDFSSGGRLKVIEKLDKFDPQDIEESLVIMLLMLPSANRQTKETLKIFRDAGGYESFFPHEDDIKSQSELLKAIPNLDYFEGEDGLLFGKEHRQIKTSLGNVLRRLKPVIIIDEGQKTYSKNAQDTIRGFNPSIVVELSATPNEKSNNLIEILGRDLEKEQMIKLDLHVTNKSSGDWKDTLAASVEKRESLEQDSLDYKFENGRFIRPINLVQVERTGKDQRGKGYIHSEDVKEYLIKERGISPNEIAIKSSEVDDIEGVDLLSPDSQIRYIVTKQALQEGWDCSFAYVLTILTNPSSKNGITQLVGRILRQPFARKTGVKSLDESYVYCFQLKADTLLKSIKQGLEEEGLGDLTGRIIDDNEYSEKKEQEVNVKVQEKYKNVVKNIYLPRFLIQDRARNKWREVSYEMDITSRIDWTDISLDRMKNLSLANQNSDDIAFSIGFSDDAEEFLEEHGSTRVRTKLKVDTVLITRHIAHLIPNPWLAHDIAKKTIDILKEQHDEESIASNLAFVIEELKVCLQKERDRLAEDVFRGLVNEKVIRFMLETNPTKLPGIQTKVKRKALKLRSDDTGEYMEKSLVTPVLDEDFNGLERSVALSLESKEQLLFWYRNMVRYDFGIQGWRKNRIFPDFLAIAKKEETEDDFSTIYILETKGDQLIGNLDTNYKKEVFDFCNELGKESSWNALGLQFEDRRVEFHLIQEEEWERNINNLFDTQNI